MRNLGLCTGMAFLLLAGSAEAQRCLHGADETATEEARRLAALDVVREVNAAQVRLGAYATASYQSVTTGGGSAPDQRRRSCSTPAGLSTTDCQAEKYAARTVGVAPLRPAEFVVFRIGQKTADA